VVSLGSSLQEFAVLACMNFSSVSIDSDWREYNTRY
jgi:hypothetical protein